MTYLLLRHLHTVLAAITIVGFLLRGYWMLSGSAELQRPLTRVALHVLDTAFLISGIAMLVLISLNPFTQSWLLAKFAGLILYVVFGGFELLPFVLQNLCALLLFEGLGPRASGGADLRMLPDEAGGRGPTRGALQREADLHGLAPVSGQGKRLPSQREDSFRLPRVERLRPDDPLQELLGRLDI